MRSGPARRNNIGAHTDQHLGKINDARFIGDADQSSKTVTHGLVSLPGMSTC
jgi:hypothetical protein